MSSGERDGGLDTLFFEVTPLVLFRPSEISVPSVRNFQKNLSSGGGWRARTLFFMRLVNCVFY